MNKQQMLNKIEVLPLFEMKGLAVKNIQLGADGSVTEEAAYDWVEDEDWKAITEKGKTEIIACMSNRYQLVQFKELYKPIVEQIDSFEGELIYNFGFGIMDIFPTDEAYNEGNDKVGIVAYTSVDGTCALNIRFCVGYGDKVITIPKKVASFRKIHIGKIKQMAQDYISVIAKVKSAWNTIVGKFIQYQINEENLKDVAKGMKLDGRTFDHLQDKLEKGNKYNLWDLCMETFNYLSNRSYKSEVHRRKRMDRFVEKIFDYQLLLEL